MKSKELNFLLRQGEGYNQEFKEAVDKKSIAKEMCAFANANGGKILLGVTDAGKVKAISITNDLKSKIQTIARDADPSIDIHMKTLSKVLIVEVRESTAKPHAVNGKYYLRQGPNSQQMKREQIKAFFQKEGLILFDEKEAKNFQLSKDLNPKAYNRFLKISHIPTNLSRKHVLSNLELLGTKSVKNAGVLLFSKKITKHIRQATIMCSVFQGTDKYKVIDSKEFDMDIYTNYTQAMNYLKSKLNTEYIIKGGPRQEVLELPEDALREALLNAVAHRNYFLTALIQIHIFQDRVEFINCGGLVSGMKISDLGKKSMTRNPLLFGLMQRMDLVERMGSGFLRIRDAMKEYRLTGPQIEADEDWFTVIFKRPDLQKNSYEKRLKKGGQKRWSETVVRKGGQKLTDKQKTLLVLIQENPQISRKELSEKLEINPSAVQKRLEVLRKKDILKRIGPAKGGHWEILI